MKKIMVILTLCVLAVACGTEESVTEFAPQDNLVSNAPLKQKVMRMVQNPTAIDNIIDESDCFSIKMPYALYANGTQVQINTTADYDQVQAIFDANDYDYDDVTLIYPITVVYADYSEETFTTALYFFNARETCQGSRELACVALTYPIKVKTYNSQNVLAQSFELGTKKALYDFLTAADAYDAVAFAYPLEFKKPDNSMVLVQDNPGLEQQIDGSAAVCESGFYQPDLLLTDVITSGDWAITYYFNESDQTSLYEGYIFMFHPDMTLTVTGSFPATMGYWNTYSTFDQPALNPIFYDPFYTDLQQSWLVTEIAENEIYFYTPSNGTAAQKYLQLTKLN